MCVNDQFIPESLRRWAQTDSGFDEKLDGVMRLYAQAIDCPRCLLFLRDPELAMSRCTHGWWHDDRHAIERKAQWTEEGNIAVEDPLYGIAMVNPEAIYVDDIDTASPDVLNVEFERKHFAHRALIHAPVYHQGKFYGILEPCVFDQPRDWSTADRAITAWVQEQLGPLAAEYVAARGPR